MTIQIAAGSAEFKFVEANGTDLPAGEFRGYLSVFGNVDDHGDVVARGAFTDTLAKRAASGSKLPMHAMHGMFGGDGLPIGVWQAAEEDDKGLRVHGKISGMGTEAGQLHYERLRDGAYGGLSIGYRVVEAVKGKQAGEPKRTLVKVDLREGSLVDDPSNALAKIDEMKRRFAQPFGAEMKTVLQLPHTQNAAAAIKACLDLHAGCLAGNDSPTADERAAMLDHLRAAYGHLMPEGKAASGGEASLAEEFSFLRNLSL